MASLEMTLGFLRRSAVAPIIRLEAGDLKMKQSVMQITDAQASGASEGDFASQVRRQIRYPLRAPVTFRWIGRDGATHEGKGNSRDISEGGAYIVTRSSPPLGAGVLLEIRFPYLPELDQFHRIEMDGQVVRVDLLLDNRAGWGFAISSRRTVLQEVEDEETGPRIKN
jgi:PilZ domain